jgi:DeoR/GlpR family transcriptional regulator of sugar metabolism
MVKEGETVFLGPGELCLEVARHLGDHPVITVITNALDVAHWLATRTRHRLIVTGGQIEERNMGLVGQMARHALSNLRADRVIVELDGVSAVEGLTHDSLPQAEIAQLMMETGASVLILAAPERVGRVAATRIAPASGADVIVTGRDAPSAYLWDLSEVGIEIVLA